MQTMKEIQSQLGMNEQSKSTDTIQSRNILDDDDNTTGFQSNN